MIGHGSCLFGRRRRALAIILATIAAAYLLRLTGMASTGSRAIGYTIGFPPDRIDGGPEIACKLGLLGQPGVACKACRSSSDYIIPRATPTTGRSASGRRSSGCG